MIQKVGADIAQFGWHCLSVFPNAGNSGASFCYTIGAQETFGHPEMMIFGLPHRTAHAILHDCVEMIRQGRVFEPGVGYTDVVSGGLTVMFKKVREEHLPEYFGTAMRYYNGLPFSGMVLFWPDRNNRLPWDGGETPSQREALVIVGELPPNQAMLSVH